MNWTMSTLRDFLSVNGRGAQFEVRRMIGRPGAMPHFIVIGAQKAGTSSLFAYLKQHTQIVRPIFKEPYYFDREYHRGLNWYGCNFPARSAIERLNDTRGRPHLTFEATATYVFDARVPRRIAADIEARKFIVLLRDPVDRAISAYWHACRMGRETRTLDDALKLECEWYEAERAFEGGNGPQPKRAPPKPLYLRRGIYAESISAWQSVFPKDSLLVLQSERMFADPAGVMARVFAFLDLAPADGIDFEPQNVGHYENTDDAREMLRAFYRPHNQALNRLCGTAMDWQ
jgi:hypothetical protein